VKIINSVPPELDKGTSVAMDVEVFGMTKGKLHRPIGIFACLSVCFEGDTVYQIYDNKQIEPTLKNLREAVWVFHNSLFDLRQLRRFAKINPRFIWDTMLVDQSMYGGYYQNFSLRDLSRRWLGEIMEKDARSEFETATHMTAAMKEYAANDAVKTLKIALLQKKEFEGSPAFKAYLVADEPMIFPILDMPGICVDSDNWKLMVEGFEKKVRKMENDLGINVMSGPQVIKAAGEHGIHIRNTQATTLKEFKDAPFIKAVLDARTYRKAVSTYGLSWLDNVEDDGRVYASYKVTGTETGRNSCSDPNMQQIPVRVLPEYRSLFIPSKSSVMLVSDISQQEPRILAYETQDAALIKAFKNGEDIHLTVAKAALNSKPPKNKKDFDDFRFKGKTINLGTSYGLSSYGLSSRLGISEEEADRFLRNYFARFRGVFNWIQNQRQAGFRNEYVRTTLGRRIYLNLYQEHQWPNNAINAPIQGGAADFTKIWIRKIWEKCRKAKIPFFIVAIIHDELVQDVLKELVRDAKRIVDEAFQETAAFLYPGIPFAIETEMGRSWACKQIDSELIMEEE
jgi:DNA polymerase I